MGIGGRGEREERREKESGGQVVCGDWRNRAVESRVRVLGLEDDGDAIFGFTHEDYTE